MRTLWFVAMSLPLWLAACSKSEPAPEPVRAVRVLTISAGNGERTQEFAGEVRARIETRLSFRVAGKIVRRNVDLGQPVKPGQVVAQIDPQDLQLGADAASAAVAAARINAAQAESDLKRDRDLRDQGFISGAELERRQTTLDAARASLDQARAQASAQRNQAAYASLVAADAGVVTGVDAEPGMVVAAGASVLRVAHDGPRDVVFSVPEDQLASVRAAAERPGALTARLWAADAKPLPARLREVSAAADPVTRTFLIKADIGSATARLGQTATVLLSWPATADTIKLPLSAVVAQQGKTSVWIVDKASMKAAPRAVQVQRFEGNEALVASGLSAGDVVVTAGAHVLTPGQQVKLFDEPATMPKTDASAP